MNDNEEISIFADNVELADKKQHTGIPTFVLDGKEDGVQVLYKYDTIWATQKAMSILFDCSIDNVDLHLKNIFSSNELDEKSTTEKISVVQTEGDREVNRTMSF